MKRRLLPQQVFTLTLFALGVAVLFGAIAAFADAAETDNFSVSLTVSNSAPTIGYVQSGFSVDLTAASTKTFYIVFNATDANGASDLNDSSAMVNVSLGAEYNESSSCATADDGNTVVYNCTVQLVYHMNAGTWSINASVSDLQASAVWNDSETFSVTSLTAIALTEASLGYTGNPGQSNILATEGAQVVQNTGNFDFTEVNLTGYDLTGSSSYIGAGNFTVNVSASPTTGQTLVNDTAVVITNATLSHGAGATEDLYIYLDIPASMGVDTYTASSNFVIDVA